MALCIKSRGIRDVDSGNAYCPDCAAGFQGPFYDKAFETVESHFLSIGPIVHIVACRICSKELTNYRPISECPPCKNEIRRRESSLEALLSTRENHMIHISGGRLT